MPKIDIESAPLRSGSAYPAPFDQPCSRLARRQLGRVAGLTKIGVNLATIASGQWSSQRHWHSAEDEFIWVVQGEVVLVTDAGEQLLRAGDCAGFAASAPNGHHLQNRSSVEAVVLEVGSYLPREDRCEYPDIDLLVRPETPGYVHRDGTPYAKVPGPRDTSSR